MDTNKKIGLLFKKVAELSRMIKKDVADSKNTNLDAFIYQVHEIALDIDDEILKSIGKIDVDENKISLYDFKQNPIDYMKMLREHFTCEFIRIKSIEADIDKQLETIKNSKEVEELDEIQMESIDLYKTSIFEKVLYRYRKFGDVQPQLKYETKMIVLQMGKEKIVFDLLNQEELEKMYGENDGNI